MDARLATRFVTTPDGRWLLPLPYISTRHCKIRSRGVGERLLDFLAREFPVARDTYAAALAADLIRVNGEALGPDGGQRVLAVGDVITQVLHRHENAIRAAAALPVTETEWGWVVDKPASWTSARTGSYNRATLASTLEFLHGIDASYMLHRIDRTVSGLIMFASSPENARRVQTVIGAQTTAKVYVARVGGCFCRHKIPGGEGAGVPHGACAVCVARTPLEPEGSALHALCRAASPVVEQLPAAAAGEHSPACPCTCALPVPYFIRCLDERRGIFSSGPSVTAEEGKASLTQFLPLAYDAASDTSYVLARPVTGRTHQIRVHLQGSGHPIANDCDYGGTFPGPGETTDDAPPVLRNWGGDSEVARACDFSEAPDYVVGDPAKLAAIRAGCTVCSGGGSAGDGDEDGCGGAGALAGEARHPKPCCIWLHSTIYASPGWCYRVDWPAWLPPALRPLADATANAWVDCILTSPSSAPAPLGN